MVVGGFSYIPFGLTHGQDSPVTVHFSVCVFLSVCMYVYMYVHVYVSIYLFLRQRTHCVALGSLEFTM